MSDMKKLMQIMNNAEKASAKKQTLTEDCNHDMPCACNSYLCESCFPPKAYDTITKGDAPKTSKAPVKKEEPFANEDGELSPSTMSQELAEDDDMIDYSDKADAIRQWADKYDEYKGYNADSLPNGLVQAMTNTGIPSDGWEENEWQNAITKLGSNENWGEAEQIAAEKMSPITTAMEEDLRNILGVDWLEEDHLRAVHQIIDTMDEGVDRMKELAGINEEGPGKEVDWDSFEFDFETPGQGNYGDNLEVHLIGATYTDGTPLSDEELEAFYDNNYTDIDEIGYNEWFNEGKTNNAPAIQEDDDFEDEDEADAERDHNDYMVDIGDEGSEDEVEMPLNIDKEMGTAVQGSAPEDVDELMAEIMNMQAMGMSQAKINYSDDMLIQMSPERIKRVYSQVMGEAVEEGVFDDMGMEDPDTSKLSIQPEQDEPSFEEVAKYAEYFEGEDVPPFIDDNYEYWEERYMDAKENGELDEEKLTEIPAPYKAGQPNGQMPNINVGDDFENEVHRLYRQTAGMDGAAEIVAKKMGVDVSKVRAVLDEAKLAEAELNRIKDLVNY